MMNNSAANKNHIPCQTWGGQNGWSTASAQELLINQHNAPHHLGLGSSSEQRTLYNLSQASNQSCVNDPSTLTSRNSHPHTGLYTDPRVNGIALSNLLFDNTAVPSAPHLISFAQQSHHTSSMMMATNQEKAVPPPSLPQQSQGSQPCRTQDLPFLTPNSPLKVLVRGPMSSQCLSSRPQDFSISQQSCQQHVNTTQASFGGQNVESSGIAGYAHSSASSSTSQEQIHWVPLSHSGGAVNMSVSGGAGHLKKKTQQKEITENIPKNPATGKLDKPRSEILRQRALLLEQLERMDQLLQSLPPDDSEDEMVPETPYTKQMDTTDGYQIQLPSKEEDENESDAGDDIDREDDPDYMPHSEGGDSDCPSNSPSDSPRSRSPSTPPKKRQLPIKIEMNASENPITTPPKKKPRISQKNLKGFKGFPSSTSTMTAGRDYTVQSYCLFCGKPMRKLVRHLEKAHSDRPEVAVAFQYPMNSKERRDIWKKLRIEGNFAHNKEVMRTGQGQLAVRSKPKIPTKVVDFVHCIYCRSFFTKKSLYRHSGKCPVKSKMKDQLPMRKRGIVTQGVLLTVGCDNLGISENMKNILGEMNYDDVSRSIMSDKILLQYGEQMCEDYDNNVKRYTYVRQNLRQAARLLLEAQKSTPMQSMEDFFHPSNFQHVVSAVNVLAGYDADKKAFSIPSLAVKLGYILQKTCCIVEDNATESGDAEKAESARSFLSLYQQKWSKLISIDALKNIREGQKKKRQVPFAEFAQDLKLLHTHMENVYQQAEKNLREGLNKENYAALAKAVLARIIVFNRRQPGEISAMPITAFTSRKKSSVVDDMDVSVSDMEKTLCRFFTRVDIRGSCGRKVPILLKPCFESSMEFLVSVRNECEVRSDNPFVFARPSTMSAYRGVDCLRTFVKKCGTNRPSALTAKAISRHFTKMLPLINLDEDEAKQIFGSRWHDHKDDTNVEREEEEEASMGNRRKVSRSAGQQTHGEPTSCKPASKRGRKRQGHHHKVKHKWDEEEVCAVEKHLSHLINKHKVPQKNDCVQCLEAEPQALKARSWKDVKNYVRNRITTLQRQNDASRDSSKSKKVARENEPRQNEPRQNEPRQNEPRQNEPQQNEPRQNNVRLQPSEEREAASGSHSEVYSARRDPADFYQQKSHGEMTSCGRTAPQKPTKSKKTAQADVQHKGKLKWDEAEVHAIEKHMMRFINEHKVPQKNDCVQCLDAEPHALKARSWKGVKDYVRNRITSLQRQNGHSRNSSKKQSKKNEEEQFLQNIGYYHHL